MRVHEYPTADWRSSTAAIEGRSFSPDDFAIALEQVVAGSAPDDAPAVGEAEF